MGVFPFQVGRLRRRLCTAGGRTEVSRQGLSVQLESEAGELGKKVGKPNGDQVPDACLGDSIIRLAESIT